MNRNGCRILFLSVAFFASALMASSCARQASVPEPSFGTQEALRDAREFQAWVLAKDAMSVSRIDGTVVLVLARNSSFKVILRYPGGIPDFLDEKDLVARIGPLEMGFSKIDDKNLESREMDVGRSKLRSVPAAPIEITHKSWGVVLGEGEWVAVDALAPKPAENVRVSKRSDGFFLAWDGDSGGTTSYSVFAKENGGWVPVAENRNKIEAFLGERRFGSFKIVARDPAGNESTVIKNFDRTSSLAPPTHVMVSGKTCEHFDIRWEYPFEQADDVSFNVEKLGEDGGWVSISPILREKQFRCDEFPEGDFRIKAANAADLTAASAAVRLKAPSFSIQMGGKNGIGAVLEQRLTEGLTRKCLPIRIGGTTTDFVVRGHCDYSLYDDRYSLNKYKADCSVTVLEWPSMKRECFVSEPEDPFFLSRDEKEIATGEGVKSFSNAVVPGIVEDIAKCIRGISK